MSVSQKDLAFKMGQWDARYKWLNISPNFHASKEIVDAFNAGRKSVHYEKPDIHPSTKDE